MDAQLIRSVLEGALRAPSAHNAQPWRLSPIDDGQYLLWYAYADKLRADPDDRDGLLAMGGFYETLRLSAQAAGLDATIDLHVTERSDGIELGLISMVELKGAPDALAAAIERRQCNRHKYASRALPASLAATLESLGNHFLEPASVAPLVSRASVLSWKDTRFVTDLGEWTRFDDRAPDGMTFDCLRLNPWDVFWLRVALRLGRLPSWLAWIYAQRDVMLTKSTGTMAVLTVESRTPEALFDCGRRLIRSWTAINAQGHAWHPMSVVIDQATVKELRRLLGGLDAVAIYRVGYTPNTAARSHRRALADVVVPAPDATHQAGLGMM